MAAKRTNGTGTRKAATPRGPAKPKKTPEQVAAEKAERAEARRKADAEKAEAKTREVERKAREKEETLRLLFSPDQFVAALRKATSDWNQIAALTDISKQVPKAHQAAFKNRWQKVLDGAESLPAAVGSLMVQAGKKSTRKVFLLRDVVPKLPATPPVEARSADPVQTGAAPGISLKERLLAEFDRLNEEGGKRFYVSLFDLRGALGDVSRSAFDEALHELRRDWILTLNPAEGRHEAVPPHVLEAGIMEQSRLLVYVARRES